MRRWALAALLAASAPVWAALPAAYAPLVVEAKGLPDRAEFDLGPALQRAQREHKSLYIYLGARDCAFCLKYEAFLDKNAGELVPHFAARYIVVDLRSALSIQAPRLFFRQGGRSLAYADFMHALGDERERQLVYPSVWLLDAQGRPLMPMPAGTGTFETVEEQLEILRLQQ
jgi:hypothetical protein